MKSAECKEIKSINGLMSFDGEHLKFEQDPDASFQAKLLAYGELSDSYEISKIRQLYIAKTSIEFRPYIEVVVDIYERSAAVNIIYFDKNDISKVEEFIEFVHQAMKRSST